MDNLGSQKQLGQFGLRFDFLAGPAMLGQISYTQVVQGEDVNNVPDYSGAKQRKAAMSHFIIARQVDGRAVMESSHACSVRWGTDMARLRLYDTPELAEGPMYVLCDADDRPYVCDADTWCGPSCQVL